jgi:hypothetical protein
MFLFKNGINETNYKTYYPALAAVEPKSTVSSKYLMVPTSQVIDKLVSEDGFKLVGASQSNARLPENRRVAKHAAYLTRADFDSSNLLVGEEFFMVGLKNSHNGGSAWEVFIAIWRKVCSNGMTSPVSEIGKYKIKHLINQVDAVRESIAAITTELPQKINDVVEMKKIVLNNEERMVLAEAAVDITFSSPEMVELNKNKRNDLREVLLRPRRQADYGNDLWKTFNVIQENVIKGGQRIFSQTLKENGDAKLNYSMMRPIKELDRNKAVNDALMKMALQMKALKGG